MACRGIALAVGLLTGTLASAASTGLRGSTGEGIITNARVERFKWTPTTRTAEEAMELTFPKGAGWTDACFAEAGCTGRKGKVLTREMVAAWVGDELLAGPDPFGGSEEVPVPQPHGSDTGDQLGLKQYVVYTRRQVCFIAAKALLGADTEGYKNGLSRILAGTVRHCTSPVPSVKASEDVEPSPLTGEFGMSLWNLMAACAADPSLEGGSQGPHLLVAKGSEPRPPSSVREEGYRVALGDAHLSACRYDDGDAGPVAEGNGLEAMPAELCTPPTRGAPGKDFMTTGPTRPVGQAIQDISAKFLGGYVFGNACGLGGGQDERLMTYMPEVFVLTFFLSQDEQHPQLREPSWILGARILMLGLDGTARFNERLELDPMLAFTSDLVEATVGDHRVRLSQTTPFLGFMSENQGFLDEGGWWSHTKTFEDLHPPLVKARRNRHPKQRAVDAGTWYSFMYQVRAWYSAVALDSYHEDAHGPLRAVVRSLGTGPFLAGLWWGDSQLGFLTVWIAQAIAAHTWGRGGLPVQYYIYADFTENPGNQCFIHSQEACRECLRRCASDPLPDSAYWLPPYAMMGNGSNKSCVVDSEDFCGRKGVFDVVGAYKDAKASELWDAVEDVMRRDDSTSKTVFDMLMERRL